ncbi:SDR family oxidoreductase [Radiobacillus kanasensis]|uniref:SDR family NAD(P)-dependent oxidoreductase n=1 Tax=Radiobacillus kanasensis TaxID=2844358 RepID=UPI001E647855|nr:SDR family oxidoreductase [Radiobacillus kanasensis]UFU00095.1 SDR family oxidoreductase [Radiobacillus kanasensis]
MLTSNKLIVTGAGSGIGKAIVNQCLHEGASVIACDVNEQYLNELKQSTDKRDSLYTYQIDVSDYERVSVFFNYVEKEHSDVDGLVNNAGIYLGKPILDYEIEEINKVIDINVKGYIYFSQMFGKKITESQSSGAIVNISSVSAMEGSSDAIYGLTKAAILGLTKSCAMNFSPYVRVNAVAPTMVSTSMMDTIPNWRKEEYVKHQLIDTPVMPKDIAHTVTFLISDKASHYTGATFDINNGGYLR